MANIRVFHCIKGRLTYEDQLSLLVWLFEVPPSSILLEGAKVTMPATREVLHIYDNYCTTRNAYKFSAPKVIQTKYGIMLRRFNETTREVQFQRKMEKKKAKASYESNILTEYVKCHTCLQERTRSDSPIRFVKADVEEGEVE